MECAVQVPRNRYYAGALALYSVAVAGVTIGDRFAHHAFANSEFCQDPEMVKESGYYGALHCSDHWSEWKSPTQWWAVFWSYMMMPIPTLAPEAKFLFMHMWANLVGWANTLVTIGLVACMGMAVLRMYAGCTVTAKRC